MAFKDFDPDLLAQAQGDRTLRRLETEIVRLAKSLKISEDDEGGVTVCTSSLGGSWDRLV